jgi:uncharacterized Zn finger protein (UPF0148 family)
MNKEEINKKIKKLQGKIEDATYEHNLYIRKLKDKIDDLEEHLQDFVNIECCGKTFTNMKDYNKHLKSQEHRMNHEKWMHCNVCRKVYYGYTKEEFNKLSTGNKMKTDYYKHIAGCHYCPICDEEFTNHMSKKRHVCEPVDNTPDETIALAKESTYDTYNEEIDIDNYFDYYLLDGLSRDQALDLETYMRSLPEGDYSITEITDEGLYYVIYETSDNLKIEVVRFRVSTRDEDYNKSLNFIYNNNLVKII